MKNRAHPEGSIAEAYIVNESLTFCSLYLQDVETKFNRRDRYCEGENVVRTTLDIFKAKIRPYGAADFGMLTEHERDILHWYVLSNCDDLRPFFV